MLHTCTDMQRRITMFYKVYKGTWAMGEVYVDKIELLFLDFKQELSPYNFPIPNALTKRSLS